MLDWIGGCGTRRCGVDHVPQCLTPSKDTPVKSLLYRHSPCSLLLNRHWWVTVNRTAANTHVHFFAQTYVFISLKCLVFKVQQKKSLTLFSFKNIFIYLRVSEIERALICRALSERINSLLMEARSQELNTGVPCERQERKLLGCCTSVDPTLSRNRIREPEPGFKFIPV